MDDSAARSTFGQGGVDPLRRSQRSRLAVTTLALLVAALSAATGCADLLGIDDWDADERPATVATSASTGSGDVGGVGGEAVGGAGGVGGEGGLIQENATCADAKKNGLETDVDCGGDSCGPCPKGKSCQNDADCATLVCDAGACGAPLTRKPCPPAPDPDNPHCGDCVENGYETDVDCGGDSCGPCEVGQKCVLDFDCATGNCDAGTCGAKLPPACPPVDPDNATCADCTLNGAETDVDCGGDACGPCALDQKCKVNADCATLHCNGIECDVVLPSCPAAPDPNNATCADCVKNGPETDVDCGGDACGPCALGDSCLGDADCASEKCDGGVCVIP